MAAKRSQLLAALDGVESARTSVNVAYAVENQYMLNEANVLLRLLLESLQSLSNVDYAVIPEVLGAMHSVCVCSCASLLLL